MEGCLTRLDISPSGKAEAPGSVFSAWSGQCLQLRIRLVGGPDGRASKRAAERDLMLITEVTPKVTHPGNSGKATSAERERPPTGC